VKSKFRHVFKIHAVNAYDESQGDENGRDDGEYFHHAVHFIAQPGHVQIG